ncbi:DUF3558 domain-containing protein [Saccharopolyspora sp. MS10]|uniref:DUF3558 domain-containing protein n=1 Tax=Saccharopolyspora sp. MS10 TaxID=3385973 RepID=UPI0039A2BC52
MSLAAFRVLAGMASLAVLASGCAMGSDAGENPPPQEIPGQGSEVKSPKEASGVEVCALLGPSALQSLGLESEGEKLKDSLDPSLPEYCKWSAVDGDATVSLNAFPGRNIQMYRDHSSSFIDYAEFDVAGHPVVQANEDDPANGSCALYLATNENEILFSFVTETDSSGGMVDPCGLAKQSLELSVAGLPEKN